MNQPNEFTEEPTLPPQHPAEYVDEPTLASPKVDDTSASRVQASESGSNDPRTTNRFENSETMRFSKRSPAVEWELSTKRSKSV